MEELVKTFHIDWKLIIAQVVNFGIVLGVLWYFALKPVQQILSKRRNEISESLDNAEQVKKKLQEAEATKDRLTTEAKRESAIILEHAYRDADHVREQKLQETRQEVEHVVVKAKADLAREREKMVQEARQQVGQLVVAVSSKVIGQQVDAHVDQRLIEETLKEVG